MSDSHPGKSSKKGGKCPTVILTDFQKREENVRLSSLQIFKNGRKMSYCHHCKFSKTGVKCLFVFFDQFSKIGGRCLYVRFDNFSLTIIQSWEEVVPFAIMTIFQKQEENCLEISMGELNARKINVQGDIVQGELNSRRIFHLGE